MAAEEQHQAANSHHLAFCEQLQLHEPLPQLDDDDGEQRQLLQLARSTQLDCCATDDAGGICHQVHSSDGAMNQPRFVLQSVDLAGLHRLAAAAVDVYPPFLPQ